MHEITVCVCMCMKKKEKIDKKIVINWKISVTYTHTHILNNKQLEETLNLVTNVLLIDQSIGFGLFSSSSSFLTIFSLTKDKHIHEEVNDTDIHNLKVKFVCGRRNFCC